MPNESRNIYKISRESAGLTQEKAAELLDISVRCLCDYESDKRRTPDITVIKMIEIYNAQYLAYQHLKTSAEVGQAYMPNIELRDLPSAILKLQKEVNDFLRCREELIDITCDGVITEDERPRWDGILKELDDVAAAIMTVKFAKHGEV